jgi:bifunctional DNA-binding transcriptional regulator/antitoxin component of YhaV-PrlF toxin-antitoxin module
MKEKATTTNAIESFTFEFSKSNGIATGNDQSFFMPAGIKEGDEVTIILDSKNPAPIFVPKKQRDNVAKILKINEKDVKRFPSFADVVSYKKALSPEMSIQLMGMHLGTHYGTMNGKPFKTTVKNLDSSPEMTFTAIIEGRDYEDSKGVTRRALYPAV